MGLADLTGTVMRTGGTRAMSGDEINERLEFIAASVEVGIGAESGSATLSTLTKDIDEGLKIFSEVLRYPVFDKEKLDLAKKRVVERLRRENDNPQDVVFREFKRYLYRDNPRGTIPTEASVGTIQREDLVTFHGATFHPDRIILGIWGDFEEASIVKKIEGLFGGWERSGRPAPKVPPPRDPDEPSIYFARKGVPQSSIVLGHLAIGKKSTDFCAFEVLNFILGGGGFTSRLMSRIRSDRGLAYSVGSFYGPRPDFGSFGAYCFTKSETTVEAISLMLDTIRELKESKVPEDEVALAKDSLINSFVFSFASPGRVVSQQVELEYEGLPADFWETYQKRIQSVTADDIYRVARKYLHPEKYVMVVVGDDGNFDRPLSEVGAVTTIELLK
jgi:predicted Zn-dependent peptidase